MTSEFLNIGGRDCAVYRGAQPRALLIQPAGDHEMDGLQQQADLLEQRCGDGFLLAAFPIADWNRELSPWDAPPVFGKEGFGHGAEETLSFIEQILLPALLRQYDLPFVNP